MTASTHQLSCMCGKVKGAVAVSAPTNHVVCYCRDCQAFARFLGQEAILDRHGGTEIVQTNASKVTLSEGMEHLAAIRLTNKGLLGSVLNSVCEPVVESVAQREPLGELYRQLCLGGMPFPRRAFPLGLDLA